MLSKVLPQAEDHGRPVEWRSSGSAVARPRPAASVRSQPAAWTTVPPVAPQSGSAAPEVDLEAQVHQQLQVAFDSGFREGEAAAMQKMDAEVRRAVDEFARTAADMAAAGREDILRVEADVVRLAMEVARRILHRELSVDPSALSALVRAALEKLASQQTYRVRVHPDQEQLIRGALAGIGRASDIEVVSDLAQPRGGAVFETESGVLDASVETQLQEIERGFADRLQGVK